MKAYLPEEQCSKLLFEVEMQNLPLYGYGIKPFTLSLIEAANYCCYTSLNLKSPINLSSFSVLLYSKCITKQVYLAFSKNNP